MKIGGVDLSVLPTSALKDAHAYITERLKLPRPPVEQGQVWAREGESYPEFVRLLQVSPGLLKMFSCTETGVVNGFNRVCDGGMRWGDEAPGHLTKFVR